MRRALVVAVVLVTGCMWPAPTEPRAPTCEPFTGTVTVRPGETTCYVVTYGESQP